MATLKWETAADWDAAQSENRVVHESYGDRTADQVQLGYSGRWLPSSTFSFWPMDAASGGITDVIGPNDLSAVGGPSYDQPGLMGTTAVSLDGSDDGFLAGDDPSHNVSALTVWAWIENNGSSNYEQISAMGLDGVGSPPMLFRKTNNNDLEWYIGDGDNSTTLISSANIWDGNRHFVCGTYDGSTMELYVDPSSSTDFISTSTGITIGNPDRISLGYWDRDSGNIQWFGGTLEEIGMAGGAFSGSVVRDLYTTPDAGSLTTGKKTS